MNKDIENVKQARESFDKILNNQVYADVIKDDNHLTLLLEMVRGRQYKRILDIGTGTGYLAFPLGEEYPLADVYGIDIAENAIMKNKERAKEQGVENVMFQVFNGMEYPFEEESFDLIVTRYAFHHFPDVHSAIQQMNRLLVQGGRILISDPMRNANDSLGMIDEFMRIKKDGHIQFYSQKELDELFISSGFEKEKQIITNMSFPFPKKDEYLSLYQSVRNSDKNLYGILIENDILWVKHIEVGNTIYVKK
ncbi:MAG: methyltransferase domain-containing protein [Lachnospiraceae bacterium]|nr:methyltransferase domain-containing protein [Lachnospiraceae bacterium]